MTNPPEKPTEGTQGFLRIKQTFGRPVLVTGYGKYLPVGDGAAGKEFKIAVNDLPIDEFHDCASSGSADVANPATDLERIVPDADGFAWYEAYSQEMTLFGEDSILGKSLVVYADDVASKEPAKAVQDGETNEQSESVVAAKSKVLTSRQDYQNRVGKPIACCTIK